MKHAAALIHEDGYSILDGVGPAAALRAAPQRGPIRLDPGGREHLLVDALRHRHWVRIVVNATRFVLEL